MRRKRKPAVEAEVGVEDVLAPNVTVFGGAEGATVETYAHLVDGELVNRIVWDGVTDLGLPDGHELRPATDDDVLEHDVAAVEQSAAEAKAELRARLDDEQPSTVKDVVDILKAWTDS